MTARGYLPLLCLLAACQFDTGGIAQRWLPEAASPPTDATITDRPLTPTDLPGAVDLPPDKPTPDLVPAPEQSRAPCVLTYGSLDDFHLCWENPQSCVFYVRSNGASCTLLCGIFGGDCYEAGENEGDGSPKEMCSQTGTLSCLALRFDQICKCERR